jgi:hypothetical protein
MESRLTRIREVPGEVVVSIDVRQWSRSEGARSEATHVSAPVEVACFSRSEDRRVEFGSRAELPNFQDPQLHARLDDGFHKFVPKDESDGVGVETVVTCLQHAGFDVEKEADVVTYRNNLNKVRCFVAIDSNLVTTHTFAISLLTSSLIFPLIDWWLPVQY